MFTEHPYVFVVTNRVPFTLLGYLESFLGDLAFRLCPSSCLAAKDKSGAAIKPCRPGLMSSKLGLV
jgi:hypothetical protein